MTVIDVKSLLTERAGEVNSALDKYLPGEDEFPTALHEAMRYAVLSSGKRLRPALVLETFELFSKKSNAPMPAACAFRRPSSVLSKEPSRPLNESCTSLEPSRLIPIYERPMDANSSAFSRVINVPLVEITARMPRSTA